MYSITEVSERFDLTKRALRFYEQHGLLKPTRYGTRRGYSQEDCEQIARIQRLARFGFTLRQIAANQFSPDGLQAQLEQLRGQHSDLARAISDLESLIREMAEKAKGPSSSAGPG